MRRVLIIDDEALLREAYGIILKAEGYEVAFAQDGKVGLGKIKSFKPDLIILDMLMPVMDGMKFLKTAHLTETHPDTKLIIVSNVSNPLSPKLATKYGVTEAFVKANLSPLELAAAVKKHCPT